MMADRNELRIPTDRVPPEILDALRQIGQRVQNESYMPFALSGQGFDEVDNFCNASSTNNNVVHVINAEVAPQSRTFPDANDSDVVSVFPRGRSSPANEFSSFIEKNPFTFTRPQSKDSDVVSVLSPSKSSPAPSRDTVSLNQLQQQQQQQQLPGSSPQKLPGNGQLVYRDCRSLSTSSSNSGPGSQPSTPLKSVNSHDDEGDDEKKLKRDVPKFSLKSEACRSSSLPPEVPAMAPRPILARSPHSSQNLPCPTSSGNPPEDDSVVRLLPPLPHSVSHGPAQESSGQQMLTPPETPESGKNRKVVAEVFTFDDASCIQERLRQNKEQMRILQQQQEQFEPPLYVTPSKRSAPSTPRHPLLSNPGTPSYRRQEVPRSPTYLPSPYRHISPVDSRLFERFEGLSTISPQTGKKEVPSSPVGSHQGQNPTPQRLSLDDFNAPIRRETRESLSPKVPKKRLDFEDGDSGSLSGVSSQPPMNPRGLQRAYESGNGAPYSPRLAASSADSAYSFSAGARALEWYNYQPYYGAADVDGDDERSSSFVSGTARSLSNESGVEFYRRLPYNIGGRTTMKRKRPEEEAENGLCTCEAMRQDFLLMAANAYKKIRRRDSSQQEFERFDHELQRTNELLHDSLQLMDQIRDVCDHRGATEAWRPRWYS